MTTTQPAPSPIRTAAATAGPPGAATQGMRRSAVVAGAGLVVLAVLAAAANFGVIQHLVTAGDPAITARDILASAGLFRLGTAALAVVVILDIVVAWALLRFFEPVHQGLARIAAWLRISYAAIFAVAISQLTGVLPLLSNARHLTAFSTGQRRAEALTKIHDFNDIWKISLILFGLHLVLIGYLACKSGYVPRVSRNPARHRRRRIPLRQPQRTAGGELLSQHRRLHLHRRGAVHALAPGEGAKRHAQGLEPPGIRAIARSPRRRRGCRHLPQGTRRITERTSSLMTPDDIPATLPPSPYRQAWRPPVVSSPPSQLSASNPRGWACA